MVHSPPSRAEVTYKQEPRSGRQSSPNCTHRELERKAKEACLPVTYPVSATQVQPSNVLNGAFATEWSHVFIIRVQQGFSTKP